MKKLIIYLGIVVVLFGGLYLVNMQSNKVSDADYPYNPYGVPVKTLNPETVKQLNDSNYQNVILPADLDKRLANKESFFQYFYSSTCPHCKLTTPVLVPIEKEMGVNVTQFNLQEFPDAWQKYNIEYTPTLVYYKDGVEVERIEGGLPEPGAEGGNPPEKYKAFFTKYKG